MPTVYPLLNVSCTELFLKYNATLISTIVRHSSDRRCLSFENWTLYKAYKLKR